MDDVVIDCFDEICKNRQKSCKTGILRVDFRWLYINVEHKTTLKIQKIPDQSDFVLTGSSQTAVFKNRQK
jgi:hypothetical protein